METPHLPFEVNSPFPVSNLYRRDLQIAGTCEKKKAWWCPFLLLLALALPRPVIPQESQRTLLLEVILTTYDVTRTETLVYLRVFSNGSAEAHSMREVDFRTLALKPASISPSEAGHPQRISQLFQSATPRPKIRTLLGQQRLWANMASHDFASWPSEINCLGKTFSRFLRTH